MKRLVEPFAAAIHHRTLLKEAYDKAALPLFKITDANEETLDNAISEYLRKDEWNNEDLLSLSALLYVRALVSKQTGDDSYGFESEDAEDPEDDDGD